MEYLKGVFTTGLGIYMPFVLFFFFLFLFAKNEIGDSSALTMALLSLTLPFFANSVDPDQLIAN